LCLVVARIGFFYNRITGDQFYKGDFLGFRDDALRTFLGNAIYLEPLNLLFYTWRFFGVLENETDN